MRNVLRSGIEALSQVQGNLIKALSVGIRKIYYICVISFDYNFLYFIQASNSIDTKSNHQARDLFLDKVNVFVFIRLKTEY